ncbi:MAG: hypothetical protein KC486_11970, partial [Myxococcales bacterium]|nr:hypothetical protein [Myxococcales bacterium]
TTTTTTGGDATTTGDDASVPPPRTPKKKRRGGSKPAAAPKQALTSADLSAAAGSVRKALGGCSGGLPGMVIKVDVTVSAAGKVTRASAHKPQRGSALGNCVEQAARKARFPALVAAADATLALRLP